MRFLLALVVYLWAAVAYAVVTPKELGNANLALATGDWYVVTTIPFTAPRTITLPLASRSCITSNATVVCPSNILEITDLGNAIGGANTLTIAPQGGDTINGSATPLILSDPGSSVRLRPLPGNRWITVSTGGGGGGGSPPLTGDVIKADGSSVTTIAPNAVTNSKMAQMPNNTVKGNIGVSPGDPTDLTAAQLTTLCQQFTNLLTGCVPASGGGTSNFLRADGNWATPVGGGGNVTAGALTNHGVALGTGPTSIGTTAVGTAGQLLIGQSAITDPTFNTVGGDATLNASGTLTVAAGVISNSKLATMPNFTVKGNVSGGTASPIDLNSTQLTTLCNQFTNLLLGCVPASGGGTTNFLRADGTWTTPPASGGTVTSVAVSNGISASPSPITGAGTLSCDLFATGSATRGCVPGSVTGGTTNFLRADGTWAAPAGGAGNVSAGGTLTNNALVIGQGTTAVATIPAMTSGQIAIGSTGAAPVPGTITAGNNVRVTGGAGTLQVDTNDPVFYVDRAPYNAVGDGVADDTTPFVNALAACASAGGGTVQIGPKQYLINSGSLTIPRQCTLIGGLDSQVGASRPMTLFSQIKYLIILNAGTGPGAPTGFTINTGSGGSTSHGATLKGVAIMAKNVNTSATTLRDYINVYKNFVGTAITNSNGDTRVINVTVWGFTNCLVSTLTGRLTVDGFLGDCTNGISVADGHDTTWIRNVEITFYATVNGAANAEYSITAVASSAGASPGLYRLTMASTAGLVTGDQINIFASNIQALNNRWTITVIDGTHIDLQGSAFQGPTNGGPAPTTGNLTYGQYAVTVTSAANIAPGQTVSGTGIQGGTIVRAVWPSKNIVWLSHPPQPASIAAGTGVTLTFVDPVLTGANDSCTNTAPTNTLPCLILSSQIRPGGKSFSCTASEGVHFVSVAAQSPDIAFYFGAGCSWPTCVDCAIDSSGAAVGLASSGGLSNNDPSTVGVWFDSNSVYGTWQGYMTSIGRAIVNTSTGASGGGNAVVNSSLTIPIGLDVTIIEHSGTGPFMLDGNTFTGAAALYLADGAGKLHLGSNDFSHFGVPYAQSLSAMNNTSGTGTIFAPASFSPGTGGDTSGGSLYPTTPAVSGNILINGEMAIDQGREGLSPTGTCSPLMLIDRWRCVANAGNISWTRVAITTLPGYSYALQGTVTATTAGAAGNVYRLEQQVDGASIQNLNWGANGLNNNVSPVVMDFCANISTGATGLYTAYLRNTAGTLHYSFTYNLPTANVWTCFSQAIPGPTSGVWTATPGTMQLIVAFDIGNGSNFNTANSGVWATVAGNPNSHVTGSNTFISQANGTVLQLTAVRLRKGSLQSAPYVPRDFAYENALARQYFQKSFPAGTAVAHAASISGALCTLATAAVVHGLPIRFTPPMINNPALVAYAPVSGTTQWYNATDSAVGPAFSFAALSTPGATGAFIQMNAAATAGKLYCVHYTADSGN